MEIIDISTGITAGLPIWPGDPKLELRWAAQIEHGDAVNLTALSMGVHTGTHIDAPLHFLAGGNSIDQLPLESLIGEAQVIAIPEEVNLITGEVLQNWVKLSAPRVLFKTKNSRLWGTSQFEQDYVALDASAAQWLVEQGCLLVGIDYLSIAPFADPAPTHNILLEHSVIIVESLDLSRVDPGLYTLVCLPVNLVGREAAPTRAVLIKL